MIALVGLAGLVGQPLVYESFRTISERAVQNDFQVATTAPLLISGADPSGEQLTALVGGTAILRNSPVTIGLEVPLQIKYGGTGGTGPWTPGSVIFVGTTAAFAQDNTNLFWDAAAKRLGIGTNLPLAAAHIALDVNGGDGLRIANVNSGAGAVGQVEIWSNTLLNGGRLSVASSSAPASNCVRLHAFGLGGDLRLGADAADVVTIQGTTHYVGIGTPAPDTLLSLYGTSAGATLAHLKLVNAGAGANTGGRISFAGANLIPVAAIDFVRQDAPSGGDAYIAFGTYNSGTGLLNERVRIASATGYVGFGTTTPGAKADASTTSTAQMLGGFAARGNPNGLEWGHGNPAGYGSCLGYQSSAGYAWLAFHGEHGTNINTWKTRGIKSSIIQSDAAGGFTFGTVANASADNQTLVQSMSLSATGNVVAVGTVTALNSWDIVNVSRYATAGSGTSGSPWTGWDTAITWTAGVHYVFPRGFYSYATSPSFGLSGIWLEGAGTGYNGADVGTVLICTGTGNVFTVDGGAGNINQIRVENIEVRTSNGSSTGNGFYFRNIVHSTFSNLRCRDAAASAFYLEGVQQCDFIKPILIGSNQGGFATKTPVNALLLSSTGNKSTTNTFRNVSFEACSGDAIVVQSGCMLNVVDGGAVQACSGRAVNINAGADSNTIRSLDSEVNTGTDDFLDAGDNNTFDGCRAASTGTTNSYHFAFGSGVGRYGRVNGGYANKVILIDSGRIATMLFNLRIANGVTNNGTSSRRIACADASGNLLTDWVQRFSSNVTDTSGQSIASGAQAVTWGTNTFDDGLHSTSTNPTRFTIPTGGDGEYRLHGNATFTGNATGQRYSYWKKNGTTVLGIRYACNANANACTVDNTMTARLVAGDYVEFFVGQSTAGALTLTAAAGENFAWVQWASQ